jgi:predicted Fe-Mo cluster-binding NifX family protein
MTVAAHKIAVASRDDKLVYHFGQADRFLIYEIGPQGSKHLETRQTTPVCDPDSSKEADHAQRIKETAAEIADCRAVLVSRIGPGAAATLKEQGIQPVEVSSPFIADAISEYAAETSKEK